MTDLPKDVTDLLDAVPTADNSKVVEGQFPPIGAQHDKPGLKVVDIRADEEWRNTVNTLRKLADEEESGEESPVIRSVLVAQREDGSLAVHCIGPMADDLACVALLSLGLQQIQSEMLY